MEALQLARFEEIPLVDLLSIPSSHLEALIGNLVFHGSQEHGTTQLMEHLLQFPLPQKNIKVCVEVFLRPTELYPNGTNRIEVLDQSRTLMPEMTVNILEKSRSEVDELYVDLYNRLVPLEEQAKPLVASTFTFQVYLHSPKSPLLNVLFFPFFCEERVREQIDQMHTRSHYVLVLSGTAQIRTAAVSKILALGTSDDQISLSMVFTKFHPEADIEWKLILETCCNMYGLPQAQLPIICSTIGADQGQRLWEVDAATLQKQEREFFDDSQQVARYGPLMARNQASCSCLWTSVSQFLSRHYGTMTEIVRTIRPAPNELRKPMPVESQYYEEEKSEKQLEQRSNPDDPILQELKKKNTTVLSSTHEPTELNVVPSQSVRSVKDAFANIYGEESLAGMDLVCLSAAGEVLVLEDGQPIGANGDVARTSFSLVPSEVAIVVGKKLDSPGSWYPAELLERSLSSRELTLRSLTQLIFDRWGIPRKFQRLYCGGRVLEDGILLLPRLKDQAPLTIELLVDRRFQASLSPSRFRDPIIGLGYVEPVQGDDGLYSRRILELLFHDEPEHNGAYDPSPISSEAQPRPDLDAEIKSWLEEGKVSEILTLDKLAEILSVLEPVKPLLARPYAEPELDPNTPRDFIKENTDKYLAEWGLPFIPTIAVMGEENSGKSTLMQRLTMHSLFPYLNRLCTTAATIIQYRRGPVAVPQFRILDGNRVRTFDLALVRGNLVIQNEMGALGTEVTPDIKFLVQITHPLAPNLNVVDLPGLLAVTRAATAILSEHINEHTMYLCAVPAEQPKDETAAETSLKQTNDLFTANPSMLSRTVGVITRFDQAQGTRAADFKRLAATGQGMGYPTLPRGYVLTMANQNGHCNRAPRPAVVYETMEKAARAEMAYFTGMADIGGRGGCNYLMSVIQEMNLEMLSGYLDTAVGRLGDELTTLNTRNAGLGLPEAHEHRTKGSRERVLNQFTAEAVRLIEGRWGAIVQAYYTEYLDKQVAKIMDICTKQQTFPSLVKATDRIKSCRQEIAAMLPEIFIAELKFWAKQIRDTLTLGDASSTFKLCRFPKEIELVESYAQSLAVKQHEEIKELMERFLVRHFDDPLTDTVTISRGVNLNFDLKFPDLITRHLWTTLDYFDPSKFATEIPKILEGSPFIEDEETRKNRFKVCQEKCLLEIVLAEVRDIRGGRS